MTLKEAYNQGKQRLEIAGSISAALDAGLLLEEVTKVEYRRIPLEANQELSEPSLERFFKLIDRRCAHEPIAYILERKDFYKHTFYVSSNVLIPRPETEHLIEAVLKYFPDVRSFLDIGTGSGIIPVTLKEELRNLERCSAVDISPAVLNVALNNAVTILGEAHGIEFLESDIYSAISERFDLIVSNPPYVTLDEYDAVAPDVRNYEPRLALTAGSEGMDCL